MILYHAMPLSDKLTDYKTDKLDKLIHDELQQHSRKYKRLTIYNDRFKDPLQKILIRMPKVKILRTVTTPTNYKRRSIPLVTIMPTIRSDVKRFNNFMIRIEKYVIKLVKELTGNNTMNLRSNIRITDNFPPSLVLQLPFKKIDDCYEFQFHAYNEANERINIDELVSGTNMSAFIELTNIWIGDNDCGINWNIKQLKIYRNFDFTRCLFMDENPIIPEPPKECYHCTYCPNAHVRTHVCAKSTPAAPPPPPMPMLPIAKNTSNDNKPRFMPSPADLLSVKLKAPTDKHKLIPKPPQSNGVFAPALDEILASIKSLKTVETKSEMKIGINMESILDNAYEQRNKENITDKKYKILIDSHHELMLSKYFR